MKISEILEGLEIMERAPNGSTFVYGPPNINKPDPCVDPSDPSCPGHRAGLKWRQMHPTSPVKPTTNLSVMNGIQQQDNTIKAGIRPIAPSVRRGGKFISQKPAPVQKQPPKDFRNS